MPSSVFVILSEDTLVITARETFSPAETAPAKSREVTAQLRELHRQLFTMASEPLRPEIRRITGVEVREATAEVETSTGTVVGVFTSGNTVQLFLLADFPVHQEEVWEQMSRRPDNQKTLLKKQD